MTTFVKQQTMKIEDTEITHGEIIKIDGIQGTRFIFSAYVTNPRTGDVWIDAYELDGSEVTSTRSFNPDRIRLVKKNARRTRTSNRTS